MLHGVVCVAGVFVTWSAHNWLLHAIELCILTFLKRTKRGSLESVKNRLHLIEIYLIQNWDFDGSKTQNTPFTNPFSSIPNDIPTEITIKSDRDLLTDGLGIRLTVRPQNYSRRSKYFVFEKWLSFENFCVKSFWWNFMIVKVLRCWWQNHFWWRVVMLVTLSMQ